MHDRKPLELKRLLDPNDDYEEILSSENRRITLRNGDYVMGLPEPKEEVLEESNEDTRDDD